MIAKYAPSVTHVVRNGQAWSNVPVHTTRIHPAGSHACSFLTADCVAVELVTAYGSRWHGFANAYIDGSLRVACELLPGQERDEVLARWDTVGTATAKPARKSSGGEPKLSKGYSFRGADMGRPDRAGDPSESLKFRLYRMSIDNGGYDNGGAYWGIGLPMYRAIADSESGQVELFIRASDRDSARAEVLSQYPNARFYR